VTQPRHTPVLLRECVEALAPRPGDVYVDCTAGLGGHAAAVAELLGVSGTVILFDLDPANLAASKARVESLPSSPRVLSYHASFADVPRRLAEAGLTADCVLADLGFASNQMDSPERGLSFLRDGPLDMRLNPAAPITAAELVNSMSERELSELIRDFGEDDAARKIASKLVQARRTSPISTTGQLATIIREAAPRRPGQGIDPATKTFQALRIAVNDELGSLERLLDAIKRGAHRPGSWLAHAAPGRPGARVGIISFHSLEDRPVKRVFGEIVEQGSAEHVHRRPVVAGDQEVRDNPRSRSAKLRVIRVGGLKSDADASA